MIVAVLAILIGTVVVVAIGMSFFLRRHGESVLPADGWVRTDEVFIDPKNNHTMRVWVDPRDNSRHYVAEG